MVSDCLVLSRTCTECASLSPGLLHIHAFESWPVQAESVEPDEAQYFPESILYHDLIERYLLVHSAPTVELREVHRIVEALRIRLPYAYVVSVVLDVPFGSMNRLQKIRYIQETYVEILHLP